MNPVGLTQKERDRIMDKLADRHEGQPMELQCVSCGWVGSPKQLRRSRCIYYCPECGVECMEE